ncbi:MAG: SprT-like domain-containing protein [Chloroflexi bacterium]|nr:SprT-like domain-containing protein [Chloroflexota bacterium]
MRLQSLDETSAAAELESLLATLCAQYGFTPAPKLEWSRRMVKTLGLAYPKRNIIRLSAWLDPEQAQSTLRHELAHIAAAKDGAKRPHGTQWRKWAKELGATPVRASSRGPVHASDKIYSHPMWGLECPKCGLRLARQRVKKGLYHRDCGPKAGRLVRSVKDTADHVFAWVLRAIDETKVFEQT